MLWPVNLAVFYPFDRLLPVAWVAIAALLVIGVTVLAIRVVRHAPYLTVGWLWYVGTLVPVIGLVQVGSHSIADRYTYIPLIGLFIVVAWGAPRLATRGRVRGPVLATAGAAVLSACAVGTWLQLRCWQNSETLFRHALQVTPNNHVAYNDLGLHLFQKGKADEAIAMYQQALRLAPNYADAHGNMGVALATRGDLTNALPHLTESVRLEPRNAEAHYNLGMLLVRLGQTEQAIPHLEKALQLDRNHARAHYNLGLALVKQNRFAEAIRHFETAARLRPDVAEVQSNLGLALGATGQFDQALAHLTQALRLNPNDPTAHYNLGVTLIRLGRLEDALAEVETAARLNSRFEQAQQAARDLRQELNKDRTP
jgi:tetratricopeptide (TPR) repeat protein